MGSSTSKYKHWINGLVCQHLTKLKRLPLRILETCQGIGDGTENYRRYGYVISFEKEWNIYNKARSRFPNALSLDACLGAEDLMNLAEKQMNFEGAYPILMPNRNMKAENGMKMLIDHALTFDLIDVDPFGAPNSFFSDVLELLDDGSFLFITTGEMHAIRFDAHRVMTHQGVKVDSSLKWARKFFREYCGEITGAQIVEMALNKGLCLHSVFMYDYYVHPSGVHRLGYYVRRSVDASEKARVRMSLVNDFALEVKRLKYKKLLKDCNYERTPCKFIDDDQEAEIKKAIIQRLDYIVTK